LKIDNECIAFGNVILIILMVFRKKHLHCPLAIVNCPFSRQAVKSEFEGFIIVRRWGMLILNSKNGGKL